MQLRIWETRVKNSKPYVVIYMIVLCCLCAAVLTFANVQWRDLIIANENFERTRAILDALGLLSGEADRARVARLFAETVREKAAGDMTVYEGYRDGKLIGTAVELIGRGKYGPIKGILAIGPSNTEILALKIYQQNETPGLGGRIASEDWLNQFRGIPLITRGMTGVIISSKEKGPNVVDGITGASKTTYQLGKLINLTIARFLSGGMQLEELDLGLDVDAVTRATPGYPKHLVKPPHLREEIKRPAFMVSPGMKNLALNKPVTSGMEEAPIIGELEQITDGVKKSGEFDFVEMDRGLQWVQIDLGASRPIHAIAVWHFYKNPVIYNDVILQVSEDPEFKAGVRTLFNNDHDNSAGLGKGNDTAYFARWWGELVDARGEDKTGTKGRYVRVYSDNGCGDEDTRFVEIAVYGK